MVFAKTTIEGNTLSHHKHLELEERETILKYHTMGYYLSRIAEILCKNKSTISRELNRNSDKDGYFPTVLKINILTVGKNVVQKKY